MPARWHFFIASGTYTQKNELDYTVAKKNVNELSLAQTRIILILKSIPLLWNIWKSLVTLILFLKNI